MTKSEHRVRVDNGKYTFVVPADDYRVSILRHGEPWYGPQGDASNALHAIMYELDAARVVVQSARDVYGQLGESQSSSASRTIIDALALHDRLTSDREPPSAWCGGTTEPEKCPRCRFTPCRKMFQCRPPALHEAVHSAVAGALHDKEPRWSVDVYRMICNEIAGRVMEAIEEVQEPTSPRQSATDTRGWIPPSQRVPEPGPCSPMAHCWISGSAVCQCGESTRDGDCHGWCVKSRLTDAQICESVTGQAKAARQQAEDLETYRAFKDIDAAATFTDLEALMRSLDGKLGWADRADAERRYEQRKARLEMLQQSAMRRP